VDWQWLLFVGWVIVMTAGIVYLILREDKPK
jgi:hypothetical protein